MRDTLPDAWGSLTLHVGDLAFTVEDHPVRVVEIGEPFGNGQVPLLVEYAWPDGEYRTPGIASEVAPETHAEEAARWGRGSRPDAWPPFRRADETDLASVPGVRYPEWAR